MAEPQAAVSSPCFLTQRLYVGGRDKAPPQGIGGIEMGQAGFARRQSMRRARWKEPVAIAGGLEQRGVGDRQGNAICPEGQSDENNRGKVTFEVTPSE